MMQKSQMEMSRKRRTIERAVRDGLDALPRDENGLHLAFRTHSMRSGLCR